MGHIVETGRHMIVSGGLGTSFAPVRLGVPPEIVHIEIGAARAAGAPAAAAGTADMLIERVGSDRDPVS